jgi:ATP-dependent DNA helicase RecG
LINQVLVKQLDDTNYELIEHLRGHPFVKELEQKAGIIYKEKLTTPLAPPIREEHFEPIRKLDDMDLKILSLCEVPCPMRELLQETGYATRMHFRNRYIVPLLERGLIEMTVPDKPNSSNQKYVVTPAGMQILLRRRSSSPPS